MKLDLSYSDSKNYFEYKVYRVLTVESMRPCVYVQQIFIEIVQICETRDLKVKTNSPLVGIRNVLKKTGIILQKDLIELVKSM